MDEDELKEFKLIVDDDDEAEIDMNYEFDAAQFYDFTRAETESEAGDAERWFDFAGNYSQSPFIIKLNWRQGFHIGVANTFDKSNNNRGLNDNHNTDEISQPKSKSFVTRSSTLMKPTASHLAKQNLLVHSIRLQRKSGNDSQNSSITDDLATYKRQKLEAGYSSKGSHLKHKAVFSHKAPKKERLDVVTPNTRPKRTIPIEPNLETAHRAERRRYKAIAESGERPKPNAYKSCGNKNITTRRKKQHASEFQEIKQMHSCNPSQNENAERESFSFLQKLNSATGSKQEIFEATKFEALSSNKKKLNNGKFCMSRNIKRSTKIFPTAKKIQDEPPINLFSKLCLTSQAPKNTPVQMERVRA